MSILQKEAQGPWWVQNICAGPDRVDHVAVQHGSNFRGSSMDCKCFLLRRSKLDADTQARSVCHMRVMYVDDTAAPPALAEFAA
jgi:hypothetical protein